MVFFCYWKFLSYNIININFLITLYSILEVCTNHGTNYKGDGSLQDLQDIKNLDQEIVATVKI